MSVAPAEGVHTPQPPNDAAVAEFNADLMDGSTVNGVGSKQSMNDNAGDEVTAQSSLEDASTKPGATEDKLESFSGSQGLHEAEIPSVPHKEIAIDGSSTEEAFLEHPAPELTPARIENHELAADIATEDKDDVAVEETAPAPESPASLLADADASTIDHASTMTGINDPASSATEMAAVEDASGAPPQQSEALISDAEDTKETSIHPAAVEVAGEEVPEGDPVPAHPAEQETTDHAPVETAPITHATEDGVVDEEHAEASILNEETTPEVASTAIAEEPTPALSAPSEVAPVEEKTSETTPAPLEPPSVTDLASQAAVEEDPILEEDVATEVPSEVVADDLVVEAAPVSDSASPDSTETLNEVAPIAPEILVEPSGSEEALETVDATISSTEPQVSEEQLVSTITRDASPSAGLIDHSAAEDGTFEEEIIEPPTSIEVSILDEDQAQADELAPVDGGIPSEPIVFEAESSFTAPVIEAPISSSPAIQEEEETPAQDPSDAVEVPAVLDVPAEISSVEPITGSSEVTVDLLGDSQEEETMDAPAESPFAETLSVPLKLSDESVQEIVLPEKPEPSIVEPHDDVAESPLFSSFIKPDKPGALDIPSTEADTASASDGPTDGGSLLPAAESEIERPKSPWTPSYSVITQGPGISAADEEEIAELPALPPSIHADAEMAPVLALAPEPTVTVTETEDDQTEVPATDVPRPWTPSYSVVVQGSPLISPVDVSSENEPVLNLQQEEPLSETPEIDGAEAPVVESRKEETLIEISDAIAEQSTLGQSDELDEADHTLDEIEFAANPDPAITAPIQTAVIVDPSTLHDPDVVEDDSEDPGSEAVVAALIESGVLTDSSAQDDGDALVASVPAAQNAIPDIYETGVSSTHSQLSSAIVFDDVPQVDEMPSERPDLETLLTAVPSEPERPRSPWTPSYSVTQQGWEGDAPIPVPPPRPEMFTSEEEDLVKPTVDVDVSTLEAPLDPPRASSPWTPSYSVSVQGSPHPVSTELTDSAPAEGKHAEPSEQDVAAVYPVSEFALPEEINPGIEPAATVVESSAEALNVLDTDAVPVPEEITPESEQDATVPPSEPADVEAAVVDEVSRTDPSVAPIGAIEEDSDEVVAEPVLIAEVEASTVTAEEPLVEESSAEDIEVAEPIAVTDVEISAALDLPVEESSAEHVEAVEVLASNSSTTAIEEAPHMLPAEESSSNKEQATATTPASTALDISPDDPFQSPDEVPEPVDEAAPAESIAESAETADLNATLVQDAIPVAVAAAENEDAVVALEDHVESSPPTVAVLSSDPATEQETTTEEDESPAADEPTFAPDSEEPAPTAAEDTLVPVPHAPTDLPETVSAKSEPTLYSMANLGPSGESSDVGPAAAEAIAESSPESAQPALVDEPSVVEDTMDSASDAVDNTEEAGPLLVQTTAEGNAPVQAASSDVPPLAELEPFPSTTADDATSVELNPPSMTDAPAESEPVPAVLIESPSITHEAAAIPPADVEILGEDPVNEVTPVASVVPLPAEPKPQAFPLMVDTSKTPDAAEEADAYPDELPISPRSRLESTASSLFFPGGWFSKLPQGRASLDIAQGEFTSPKTTSPTLPPSIPSPTTETTETQHQQSEDKKGKWCVVM